MSMHGNRHKYDIQTELRSYVYYRMCDGLFGTYSIYIIENIFYENSTVF